MWDDPNTWKTLCLILAIFVLAIGASLGIVWWAFRSVAKELFDGLIGFGKGFWGK